MVGELGVKIGDDLDNLPVAHDHRKTVDLIIVQARLGYACAAAEAEEDLVPVCRDLDEPALQFSVQPFKEWSDTLQIQVLSSLQSK